jgi:hypothetical protein
MVERRVSISRRSGHQPTQQSPAFLAGDSAAMSTPFPPVPGLRLYRIEYDSRGLAISVRGGLRGVRQGIGVVAPWAASDCRRLTPIQQVLVLCPGSHPARIGTAIALRYEGPLPTPRRFRLTFCSKRSEGSTLAHRILQRNSESGSSRRFPTHSVRTRLLGERLRGRGRGPATALAHYHRSHNLPAGRFSGDERDPTVHRHSDGNK